MTLPLPRAQKLMTHPLFALPQYLLISPIITEKKNRIKEPERKKTRKTTEPS